MDDLFAGLNPEQRFAVETIDGPLSVVASAGSGKTRVITRRIAHLISRDVPPDAILGVTFTNKAAREMRERVARLSGYMCKTVCTFHGFCAQLLRSDFDALGRSADFTIYDDGDQRAVMKQVVEELKLDADVLDPGDLLDHLSARRNARPGFAPAWGGASTTTALEGVERALARYLERLAASEAVDFDELLAQAVRLFEERPEILAKWRNRLPFVSVDEFQDTNYAQYRLVRLLTEESRNLCVTGDPDQSIYSWRGADPRNFDDFRRDYPEAQEVVLAQNYRSTNAILRAASEVMREAPSRTPKTLWSELGEGEPVRVVRFHSDREESDAIAEAVRTWAAEGFARRDQAIMFRTNALSLPVERALVARGIPYRVLGGPEFFGRTEIKDVLAYLRVLVNPRDEQAFLRILNVPPRGLGAKSEDALVALARERRMAPLDLVAGRQWPAGLRKAAIEALERFADLIGRLRALPTDRPASLLSAVLEETDYIPWFESRPAKGREFDPLRNLEQLRVLARDFEKEIGGTLLQFLEQTALVGERDRESPHDDPVTLLTIHAAKGLEFDSVILVGCEEELIPHVNALRDPDGLEEERRLLHVAMTRARKRLVLTLCERRTRFGRDQYGAPSRFLKEIGTEGVEFFGGGAAADVEFDPGRALEPEADPEDPLLNLNSGARVRHPTYGEGDVVRVRSRTLGLDATVVVRFEDGTERALVLRYSKLEALDVEF